MGRERRSKFANDAKSTADLASQLAQRMTKEEVDTKVAQIVSGSPKGTYATLAALQTAFPTGTTGIYIVSADGNWYYWNGSTWVSGGVYQNSQDITKIDKNIKGNGLSVINTLNYGTEARYTQNAGLTSIYVSNRPIKKNLSIESIDIKSNGSATGKIFVIEQSTNIVKEVISVSVVTGWNNLKLDRIYDTDVILGFYGLPIKFTDWATDGNPSEIALGTDGLYSSTNSTAVAGNTITITKVISTLFYFAIRINAYYKVDKAINDLYNADISKSLIKNGNILVVDKTVPTYYQTIQSAVNAATSNDIILVMPGTYVESVSAFVSKDVNIIGFDRDKCILKNSYATYELPPLEISRGCVKNMTIIAENNGTTTPENNGYTQGNYMWGAYAIHYDAPQTANSKLTIENCKLVSYWNAGIGVGFYGNDTLRLKDCEIESYTDYAYGNNATLENGALLVHPRDADNISNQNLIVENCKLISKNQYTFKLSALARTTSLMNMSFYKTMCYSLLNGKTNVLKVSGLFTGTGWKNLVNVTLTPDSWGNNLSDFNA
jgi:hypothetical protein